MANRVAGVTSVMLDGQTFRVKGNVNLRFIDSKREMVVGVDGVHGYKEEPRAPGLTLTITVGSEVVLRALQRVTDSTLIVEGPTRATFILSGACYTGDAAYNLGEGELELTYDGVALREISPP